MNKTKKNKSKKKRNVDIPSSNFATSLGPKSSKFARSFSHMQSIPKKRLSHANPAPIFNNQKMPEKYASLLDRDQARLAKTRLDRKKKAHKIKDQLKERIAKKEEQIIQAIEKEKEEIQSIPTEIFYDREGSIRDKTGNIVNLRNVPIGTLNINLNRMRESKIKQLLSNMKKHEEAEEDETIQEEKALFDNSLKVQAISRRNKRRREAFNFLEKGTVIQAMETMTKGDASLLVKRKVGDLQGAEVQLQDDMMPSQTETSKKLTSFVRQMSSKNQVDSESQFDPIPQIEWWDRPLLPETQQFYMPELSITLLKKGSDFEDVAVPFENIKFNQKVVEDLVFQSSGLISGDDIRMEVIKGSLDTLRHDVFDSKIKKVKIGTILTKEEKIKMSKTRRREYQQEIQEEIKYGKREPPPPRLTLSNFMRILGDEATQNPTKIAMEVKKIVEQRQSKHLKRNEARKLTKDQKRDKILKKLKKDSAKETKIAIFAVRSLHNFKIQGKVVKNAEQKALNGFGLLPSKKSGLNIPTIVVVEGGPRSVKFYKRLMLQRIDWSHKRSHKSGPGKGEEGMVQEEASTDHYCRLVWEGTVNDPVFSKWSLKVISSEVEGRNLFLDKNMERYWDKAVASFNN